MSLGGGSFNIQNKVLPGAYINFVSTQRGDNTIGERGVGAMGIELSWGKSEVFVTKEDINNNCKEIFGYDYNADELMFVREFFKHGKKLYMFKLNTGGNSAKCSYATAKYAGVRGNDITVNISKNVDNGNKYDFDIYLDSELVYSQSVTDMNELSNNEFVIWNKSTTITSGVYKMTGGTNGDIKGSSIIRFCNKLSQRRFNAVCLMTYDKDLQNIMIEYTKRMRDEYGVKFQCVVYNIDVDYEGVINVVNSVNDSDIEYGLIAWVCGATAGCDINESLTNMKYDGELVMDVDYNQNVLEKHLKLGHFIFHKVNEDIRVLKDINCLTSFSVDKGEVFSNNQTVRVCDQIATDISAMFVNNYLGKVPNDNAGRNSLWSELVKYHEELADVRAIEDFSEEDIEVSMGSDKTSVVVNESIMPVNAMDKLYMSVYVE